MINQTRKLFGENNGNVLLITMLIIFAVAVIGTFLASMSTTDLKISANQRTHTQALSTAEAGLSEVVHRLSLPNPTNVTVGGWTGNAAISDTEPWDPNWRARVFLASPAVVPAGGGSDFNTGTVQDPGVDFLAYSQPAGNEGIMTVQHKWRDRNSDTVRDPNEIVRYDPAMVPPENFNSGFPIEVITLTGQSGNASRTIEAEVTKTMLTPKTLGAVFSNDEFRARELYGFCGFNHDYTMPSFLTPPACFPFHIGLGNLPAIANTGADIRLEDGGEVVGAPVPVDSDPSNPWYPLNEALGLTATETADLLADADNTSWVTPMDGITYINGDLDVTSATVGSGLLYVTGEINIQAPFEFRGLVYCEDQMHEAEDLTWILGSLIMNGGGSGWEFDSDLGTSGVLYSMDAIRISLSQYLPMQMLSWRER